MLISHLRESTFVYHQASISKPHLTWSFLCPLICPHISLNFIPVTHLFSRSHSFDSHACIVHFAKLTAEKMAFIYITWSFLPFPCHTCAFFQFVFPLANYLFYIILSTLPTRPPPERSNTAPPAFPAGRASSPIPPPSPPPLIWLVVVFNRRSAC